MTCGAVLYFDQQTDAALRGLWQSLEDAGLPSAMMSITYPPHLTMLVCEGMDLEGMRPGLARYIAEHPPLEIGFSGFGIFPSEQGVVYLAPTPNRALLDLHLAFWEMARPFIRPESSYYQPNIWVPHVTLDYNLAPAQIGDVVAHLSRTHWPHKGILRELVIADFVTSADGVGAAIFNAMFQVRLGSYL